MIRSLTPPSAGQPISASFFAELLREIRANRPLQGQNTRVQRTPNGTHISALPQTTPGSAGRIPGCFEIRRPSPAATEGGEEDPGGFDNPYFTVGAHLYQCADAIDMGFDYDDCIVALCVNTTSASPEAYIESFTDFTELQEYAKDRTVAVHPLYLLGEGGVVLADLRNIPVFPQWEHKED